MGGAQSGSPRVKVGQGWGSIEDIRAYGWAVTGS